MDQVLSPAFAPFTFALGLMLGLLALELLSSLLGLSLQGSHPDLAPDLADLQASFDLTPHAEIDIPALVAASTALDHASDTETAPDTGLLAMIGLGQVPLLIWLAAMLFSFGLGGFFLQTMATSFGSPLSPWVAVPIALFGALKFARGFATTFARLIPRLETTATTVQFMGGLRGVVTQGTARAGAPAEVRLRDRHGNLHHMRCEPFRARDVIAEGTQVLTLRQRLGPNQWGLRIIAIS